ncbi:MAG: hypothetical protein ACKODH_07615 [Limisphaerales bacterium]
MPYVQRVYPSPKTEQEITVNVKEFRLTDEPVKFAQTHFDQAWTGGCHLLPTDIRGGRAWGAEEAPLCVEQFGDLPREHCWMEVWEIRTQNQLAVLDLVKFTGFYSAQTMERFDEFSVIATPLLDSCGGRIRRASSAGVALSIPQVEDGRWYDAAADALGFNAKHLSIEQPRSTILKDWYSTKTVWFGFC